MNITVTLTEPPIPPAPWSPPSSGRHGVLAEFRGIVRGTEAGEPIGGLRYRAYAPMAEKEMERILRELAEHHPCQAVAVIHRVGAVAVGETAIYIGVAAAHRTEAFGLLTTFMDRLKEDVPIWKVGTLPPVSPPPTTP